ncbi:Fe-S cluster assembly ATPase SufC [Spirochaeta cellobiosiphila]|uniref:Fe-S cluster assembly ATPase SufC n=1 Tax=Spirochaeta cellobiosiphila TaxID=504483 RepID=UPI0004221CCA|nr:Fe-S cluster assembly ATPase SufC [Spirochaeta cellobiosiphila]
MSETILDVKGLRSQVEESHTEAKKEILKGVDLTIKSGEIHVLMGINGSGKSTLSNVLMGHPSHEVIGGDVTFNGKDLLDMEVDERAREGLFLAFQYPDTIQGLPLGTFLKSAVEATRGEEVPFRTFKNELDEVMTQLNIPREFLSRSLNDGFSGGEKKRTEMVQMNLLNPKLAILDETDSGLDIDALKLVFENIKAQSGSDRSYLIITHYNKVLDFITPDKVHIMKNGKIVKSGGPELSKNIIEQGFEAVIGSDN